MFKKIKESLFGISPVELKDTNKKSYIPTNSTCYLHFEKGIVVAKFTKFWSSYWSDQMVNTSYKYVGQNNCLFAKDDSDVIISFVRSEINYPKITKFCNEGAYITILFCPQNPKESKLVYAHPMLNSGEVQKIKDSLEAVESTVQDDKVTGLRIDLGDKLYQYLGLEGIPKGW